MREDATRVDWQRGWLLSRRPYRDTSDLIELLTARHGRIGLIARGSRSPRSRSSALLAPFQPLLLSWRMRGDLGLLTAIEPDGPAVTLTGERQLHGWYLNELLLRLLPRHDPLPTIADDYAAALAAQCDAAPVAEFALRRFEHALLAQLGYGLPLDAAFVAAEAYRLNPDGHFERCAADAPTAVPGRCLLALRDGRLPPDDDPKPVLDGARRLLRQALEPHAPRASLRTPKLLRELRRLGGDPGGRTGSDGASDAGA